MKVLVVAGIEVFEVGFLDPFTYTASDASGAGSNNIATYSFTVDNGPPPVELVGFVAKALNYVDAQLS